MEILDCLKVVALLGALYHSSEARDCIVHSNTQSWIDYSGNVDHAWDNTKCIPWNRHRGYTDTHSYCRFPDENPMEGPWCFVSEKTTTVGYWKYCDIPRCLTSDDCVVPGDASTWYTYRGKVDHAWDGTPCVLWSDLGGEWVADHNYCRSAGYESDGRPWCYVSEERVGVYWKYCDIPECESMDGYKAITLTKRNTRFSSKQMDRANNEVSNLFDDDDKTSFNMDCTLPLPRKDWIIIYTGRKVFIHKVAVTPNFDATSSAGYELRASYIEIMFRDNSNGKGWVSMGNTHEVANNTRRIVTCKGYADGVKLVRDADQYHRVRDGMVRGDCMELAKVEFFVKREEKETSRPNNYPAYGAPMRAFSAHLSGARQGYGRQRRILDRAGKHGKRVSGYKRE